MKTLKAIWHWIDRDLYDPRPISMLLVVVPFLPVWIAQENGASRDVQDVWFWVGAPFGFAWMAYVLWRGLKDLGRSLGRTAKTWLPLVRGRSGTTLSCKLAMTYLLLLAFRTDAIEMVLD